ncbi:MAG: YbjQ family protein [Ignavibacteria bacterium]|nr:YbjQ family protein [Ignavibacteria bacterium]
MFNRMFITTAFTLDGYSITRNLGVVRGITVRSRSLIGNIGAVFQILVGGKISLYQQLCEKAREEAFSIMIEHAEEIGANAIIGMRYDANEVAGGVTEVLAYGTAVIVEKCN